MATRAQLLNAPHSGARPLVGSGGGRQPARKPDGGRQAAANRRAAAKLPPPTGDVEDQADDDTPARPPKRAAATRPAAASTSAAGPPSAAGKGASPGPASSAPGPAGSRQPVNLSTEGAGAFLALFLYPLAVNLLNGGPGQMWGWIKAKWVNQPYGAPSGAGGPGSLPPTGAGGIFPTPSGQSLQGQLLNGRSIIPPAPAPVLPTPTGRPIPGTLPGRA